MTPTYPKMKPTSVSGVVKFEMSLFNARDDVEWFDIAVLDKDWNLHRFASESKLLHVMPKQRMDFNVYLRTQDIGSAVYICTRSRLVGSADDVALVASTICSRIDGELP